MDLSSVDVDRFEVGRFGDLRLEKRGPGAIRLWWLRRVRAFWLWLAGSVVARSDLGGFYATRQ